MSNTKAAYEFAKKNATPNDPASILRALDRFGWERQWMMFVGAEKGAILEKHVAALRDGAVALELGTFCGYSAIRIARLLGPNARLISVEPDEHRAALADKVIALAGLSAKVEVVARPSTEVIRSCAGKVAFDLVFLDHVKDLYLSDTLLLESSGCLKAGAVLVADNVIFPGAPDYLRHVRGCGRFETTFHKSDLEYTSATRKSAQCPYEYMRSREDGRVGDGVEVSRYLGGVATGEGRWAGQGMMSTTNVTAAGVAPEASSAADAPAAPPLPTLFVSHGPGPNPLVWEREGKFPEEVEAYKALTGQLGLASTVKAILVVSAHFEAPGPRRPLEVTSQRRHPQLLFDYGGFPAWTYDFQYSPGGSPAVARRVCALLNDASIACLENTTRNLDHGVFVPLLLMFPKADIPVLQVSLPALSDDGAHNARAALALGRALAPLRREGVLIMGSGQVTHGRGKPTHFVAALTRVLAEARGAQRERLLVEWERLPQARQAHGREEHLLPLHVAVAAAGDGVARLHHSGWWGNLAMAHFSFS